MEIDRFLIDSIEQEIIYTDSRDLLQINTGLDHFGSVIENKSILWNQIRHVLLEVLRGPIAIFNDLSIVIFVVLLNRIAHLLIDLIQPHHKSFKDIVTIIFGWYQLHSFINRYQPRDDWLGQYILTTVIVIYTIAVKSNNFGKVTRNPISPNGFALMVLSLSPILVNEYLIHSKGQQENTILRAILMTLSMKFVTAINNRYKNPISTLAYLMHPASCLFGPWHQDFNDEEPLVMLNSLYIGDFGVQLWRFSITLFKAFLILSMSEIIGLLKHLNTASSILFYVQTVYLTAQEFRFSHYFACYISQALITLSIIPTDTQKFQICDINKVEWPRSLVDVVVSWNIPMHRWLKAYIFSQLKARLSNVMIVILITYLISSTLHGFKFNIWAVLLSLGLFSWVEHNLRAKLSRKLNACILTRDCQQKQQAICSNHHTRTKFKSVLSPLINFYFRIMAIIHLSYLGCIFQGNPDEQSYSDVLNVWSNLYYISHVIFVLNYLVVLAI